jgi:hypothetical protein
MLGIAVTALLHWRFRTGWHMRDGFLKPPAALFPTYVCLLYAALPFLFAFVGMTGALASGSLANDHPARLTIVLFLFSSILMCAGAAWGLKEFFKPSTRRTPAWLKRDEHLSTD